MSQFDPAIKTKLRFVAGFEPGYPVPDVIKGIGLQHRFAVIQDTFRPDLGEMYFDHTLWLQLFRFARTFLPGTDTGVMKWKAMDAESPDTYLSAWLSQVEDERDPEGIVVRDERKAPVLYVDPEYWVNVGGPWPYSDSYTYSIYSYDDLSDRVLRHLRESPDADRWVFSPRILMPGEDGLEPHQREQPNRWLTRLKSILAPR